MNILYLTNQLDIGGITSYVFSLAKGFKGKNHNVYIASSGGQLLDRFNQEGIVFIPIPIRTKSEASPKILASAFKLLKALKENHIDIIHSHSRTTQVLGYLLSRKTGIKYVSTCHGFFKKRFSRRVFPCWGLKVIAISEPVKKHLIEDFKVKEENVRLIFHGINMERFKVGVKDNLCQQKKIFGLGEGPVIGVTSRLAGEKGHSYLIEAMPAVLKEVPSAQLLIIGEGKVAKKLAELTHRLGLQKNIFFVSSCIKPEDALSVMDLFIMPSLEEGLGLSLMEAMAVGLPVIGTNVGGIKNLIRHNINGLLVEPADTKQLAKAILELLKDRGRAEALGRNAAFFIKENFPFDKMISETEKVYLECLESKS
jgi:glycosyltransferase involved in cell wall biosynthesis